MDSNLLLSDEEILNVLEGLHAMLLLKEKFRRIRTIGVQDIFQNRRKQGDGYNLLQELRGNSKLFYNYTRLNFERFDYLHNLVAPLIQRKRVMKTVIPTHHRLAITLRFLAVGEPLSSLSFAYRIGKATVSVVVRETMTALIKVLAPLAVAEPKCEEDWKYIAAGFQDKWNLPHCLGALDGKHIRIQQPKATHSTYFNYKKFFSTVLMALVDADYSFIMVDVGSEGSLSDNGIYYNCLFGKRMRAGQLKFPPSDFLPGSNKELDYFVAGDGIFPLRKDLLKPYPGQNLRLREAIFNYRLSRARRVVENAFGILVARWRIFHKPLCCNLDTTDDIVLTAVCLHNFIMRSRESPACREEYAPPNFVDVELDDGSIQPGEYRDFVVTNGALVDAPVVRGRRYGNSATAARNLLRDYVNEEGAVPFQLERVRRGFWGARITAE